MDTTPISNGRRRQDLDPALARLLNTLERTLVNDRMVTDRQNERVAALGALIAMRSTDPGERKIGLRYFIDREARQHELKMARMRKRQAKAEKEEGLAAPEDDDEPSVGLPGV